MGVFMTAYGLRRDVTEMGVGGTVGGRPGHGLTLLTSPRILSEGESTGGLV